MRARLLIRGGEKTTVRVSWFTPQGSLQEPPVDRVAIVEIFAAKVIDGIAAGRENDPA